MAKKRFYIDVDGDKSGKSYFIYDRTTNSQIGDSFTNREDAEEKRDELNDKHEFVQRRIKDAKNAMIRVTGKEQFDVDPLAAVTGMISNLLHYCRENEIDFAACEKEAICVAFGESNG